MATTVPGSFLDEARKARERLNKPREKDFDLPGYTGIFKVRYSPLSWAKTRELIEQRENFGADANADVWYAANSLMEECKAFLVKHDDEWVEWKMDGEPVRYDEKLVEALGLELPAHPQPHDVVYALFGGLGNGADRLVMSHHLTVLAWSDSYGSETAETAVENLDGMVESKT